MSKKLLFVMTRLPFPPNSGRKVSLYHYCRGLHERYGYDIYLYCFPEWDQSREVSDKPDFIKEIRFAHPVGAMSKAGNLLFRSLVGKNRMPFQCALYYSAANCRAIRAMAEEIKPDVIVTDMIRTAPYYRAFADLDCTKILDLDDLLSRRYAQQKRAKNDLDAAGHYAGGMPSLLRRLNRGVVGRTVLGAEERRVRRAELRYARLYDKTVLVSLPETKRLNEMLGEERAFAVPIGVDAPYFANAKRQDAAGVCFVGNLHVAANVASLRLIANEILPHVKSDVKLRVIGPAPDELRAQYADHPRVEIVGEVPDLRPAVGASALALLPVAFGSGIKTKILEAMAMGLPVVTNSVGAEGIFAENGEEFFVEDDPRALAARVDALLADPALCAQVGERAARFTAENFDWESIFDRFALLGL